MRILNTRDKILKRNGITRREGEIVEHICKGMTNQEIADKLFISLQTVKDHTHRIYLKLDVKNRMQLIHLLQK
jgi:DNA-binding NarL/FixJ family response regulator